MKWNIELAKRKFEEYGLNLIEEKYINTATKMLFTTHEGYISAISLSNLLVGQKYYIFSKFNPYTIENIKLFLKINNCSSTLLSDKFVDNVSPLSFQCECGEIFNRSFSSVLRKKGCKCLNCIRDDVHKRQRFSNYEIIDILNNYGLEYIDGEYKNNQSKLCCKNKDGHQVVAQLINLKNNKSPLVFSLKFNRKNFDYNVNHYIDIHNLDCKYLGRKNSEEDYNKIILSLKCSCGNVFDSKLSSFLSNNKHQQRCKICSKNISTYELRTEKWLKENNIKYIPQYKFNDCKVKRILPFDFYLPKNNICIEVDGEQHFKENNNFGKDAYVRCLKYDKVKTDYCEENNIKLLRIPYWKFYKEKYKEILSINILQE